MIRLAPIIPRPGRRARGGDSPGSGRAGKAVCGYLKGGSWADLQMELPAGNTLLYEWLDTKTGQDRKEGEASAKGRSRHAKLAEIFRGHRPADQGGPLAANPAALENRPGKSGKLRGAQPPRSFNVRNIISEIHSKGERIYSDSKSARHFS